MFINQLKSIDTVVKYFFEYNRLTKEKSIKNNGLHAGHLAILIAMNEMIPPHEAKDYFVTIKCLQFQMMKSLNYVASQQTVWRDVSKLVNLGILKEVQSTDKFKLYQYNI